MSAAERHPFCAICGWYPVEAVIVTDGEVGPWWDGFEEWLNIMGSEAECMQCGASLPNDDSAYEEFYGETLGGILLP